jgi:hypothetical protein
VAFLQQAFSERGPIIVVTDATGRVSQRDDGEHPDYTLTWQRLALP